MLFRITIATWNLLFFHSDALLLSLAYWDIHNTTVSSTQWRRKPQRPPGRGGGGLNHSRSGRRSRRGCDDLGARLGARQCRCSRTGSRDSPSDRRGRRLSDSSRQKPCCGPRGEARYHRFYLPPNLREDGAFSVSAAHRPFTWLQR